MARLPSIPGLNSIAGWPRTVQLGVAAGAIALLAVALLWLRTPDYKVLFSNIEDRDGGAIVQALTQMNVPYRLAESGNAILVPADKVHEARLQLAQQGLPRSGEAGFELLDQTRFGASQFAEQVTYQRALEGELSSSIQSLHAVQHARVHLAIPRESLFVRDRQPPTASVLVTLYPGRTLSEAQVNAVTWLVSSSVPHLTAENVSVVDQNGRLLTAPTGDAAMDATRRDLVHDIEQRTVQRILTLLNPIVGAGNVRAQVSADLDFSQREQTSEVYRPNQQPGQAAVRSRQSSASTENGVLPPQGIPGALTNQPPGTAVAPIDVPPAAQNPQNQANAQNAPNAPNAVTTQTAEAQGSARSDATINYEVDRTISHTKDAIGQIRRLSVAVVVNYRELDGEPAPLPAPELEQLNELVRQAMGYSAERGDSLSVVNSQFTPEPGIPFWQNPLYLDYSLQLVKYLIVGFVIYLLWQLWLRRMVEKAREEQARAYAERESEKLNREQAEAEARLAAEMNRYESNLNMARQLAERDPRAVAMVLRQWMESKNGPSET
ncbi:MAG: flagellar basal-body MS-ring/collar protein FliF [Burkholderiaceae bacterium]